MGRWERGLERVVGEMVKSRGGGRAAVVQEQEQIKGSGRSREKQIKSSGRSRAAADMTVLGGRLFGAWGERHAPAAHPAGGFDAEARSGIGAHEPAGEVAGEVGGIPEK